MRKAATALLTLPLLALAACGPAEEENEAPEETTPDAEAWFTENCSAQVSDVYTDFDFYDEPRGEPIGQAFTQGAIRPPSDLDESAASIGIYSYDEAAETATHEEDASADDLFCLEPSILDDGWMMLRSTQVDGPAGEAGEEVTLARLRSPEHPDGVWVEYDYSSKMGWDTETAGEECATDWSPATDITPIEDAAESEEPLDGSYMQSECRNL